MAGNKRKNPKSIEDFVRKNTTLIAKQVEENPNAVNHPPHMYKCKDCDKQYDNFQALGGHRASHRSTLKTATLESDSEAKIHECRICGERFAIGQALGGHMRKHWLPKVEKKEKFLGHRNKNLVNITNSKTALVPYLNIPDESCSSSSIISNSNGKEVLKYDLNLTPHENDESQNSDRLDNGSFSEGS